MATGGSERTPEPLILPDQAAWEAWLSEHHADAPEAWLAFAKKHAPTRTVTHDEALEVALCFGWIDARVQRLDEHHVMQRFTHRRPKSKWSLVNRTHAERLIAEGRMHPAGQDAIDAARADGRWDAAYPPQSTIQTPPDLQRRLDSHPEAAAFFATLKSIDRYAFLYRLHHVTDPTRRAKRIDDYIDRLSDHRTL